MVFAAGLGTRLQSLTRDLPKALVPVSGDPLLMHCLRNLKARGFDKIVINVHHFADLMESYLREHPIPGVRILISDERAELLETGGGIRKASSLLRYGFDRGDEEEPVLLHNVDIFSNLDLAAMVQSHIRSGADATLSVMKRKSGRYLYFDHQGRLKGWQNQSSGEQKPQPFDTATLNAFAFSGIHVVSAGLMRRMQSEPEKFSIMDFYLNTLQENKYTSYIQENMKVIDVGKPESLKQAELFLQTNLY